MAEEEDNATEEAAEQKGGMMKMIILGVVGLALLGGGIFAGMAIMGEDEPDEDEAVAEEVAPPKGPAIYQSLHPPLVVNFRDEAGDAHFMQITMEVMSRDQDVINAVRENIPVIRNGLILLYGQSVYEEVTTREGKERMLADGLAEIQRIMTEETGDGSGVEAVYFTALVIQ